MYIIPHSLWRITNIMLHRNFNVSSSQVTNAISIVYKYTALLQLIYYIFCIARVHVLRTVTIKSKWRTLMTWLQCCCRKSPCATLLALYTSAIQLQSRSVTKHFRPNLLASNTKCLFQQSLPHDKVCLQKCRTPCICNI